MCAVLFLAGIIPSYTLKAHNLDVLGAGTYFLMMFSLVTVLVAMQPKGNTVDAGISLSEQIDVKKLEKLVNCTDRRWVFDDYMGYIFDYRGKEQ